MTSGLFLFRESKYDKKSIFYNKAIPYFTKKLYNTYYENNSILCLLPKHDA